MIIQQLQVKLPGIIQEHCYDFVMITILDYGATGQSSAFESDQNQGSTPSRTVENTTLKTNTSEDHNSPGGESKISKPDESGKTKPLGKLACSCVVLYSTHYSYDVETEANKLAA